jgi:hypothetical protein
MAAGFSPKRQNWRNFMTMRAALPVAVRRSCCYDLAFVAGSGATWFSLASVTVVGRKLIVV